jgi:hypothetical protein
VDLLRKVQSPEKALQTGVSGDWGSAVANFKAAFENLAQAFTSPLIEPSIAVMNKVAGAMQAIAGSLSGVDPTVLGLIGGGGLVAALAGITGLLSLPFFRMLALGHWLSDSTRPTGKPTPELTRKDEWIPTRPRV